MDSPHETMIQHLQSIHQDGLEYFWHQHRYQLVQKMLPPETSTLLDFGYGTGDFLVKLGSARPALLLYGYDIHGSPALIQGTTKANVSQIHLLASWPASQLAFDVITMLDVLEHIADEQELLGQLFAQIRSGGRLILTVPAAKFLWSDWDRRLGHFRRYDQASISQVLESAGFELCSITYFFSYLTPFAVWRKFRMPANYDQQPQAEETLAEFPRLNPIAHAILKALGWCERILLSIIRLPFGTSILVVARK